MDKTNTSRIKLKSPVVFKQTISLFQHLCPSAQRKLKAIYYVYEARVLIEILNWSQVEPHVKSEK